MKCNNEKKNKFDISDDEKFNKLLTYLKNNTSNESDEEILTNDDMSDDEKNINYIIQRYKSLKNKCSLENKCVMKNNDENSISTIRKKSNKFNLIDVSKNYQKNEQQRYCNRLLIINNILTSVEIILYIFICVLIVIKI